MPLQCPQIVLKTGYNIMKCVVLHGCSIKHIFFGYNTGHFRYNTTQRSNNTSHGRYNTNTTVITSQWCRGTVSTRRALCTDRAVSGLTCRRRACSAGRTLQLQNLSHLLKGTGNLLHDGCVNPPRVSQR